jgi:hypothetical protein
MRRIYIRQTEYEVIDSFYEPTQPPIMLPVEEKKGPGFKFWFVIVVVAALIVFGGSIDKAKAQQGVCNFYGVCGGGSYGPPPSVNVYPQVVIVPVPQQAPAYYPPEPPRRNPLAENIPMCSDTITTGCQQKDNSTPLNCTIDYWHGMTCR